MMHGDIDRMLGETAAYHSLDPSTQQALRESMAKVVDFLSQSALPEDDARQGFATQLAPPNLQQALRPRSTPTAPPNPGATPRQAGGGPSAPAPAAGGSGGAGTTGRVGEVARATLNAIDFPGFVASLIQGTFQAIVDASIQQMEAYAELLKSVAGTVDQFMADNVTDGHARDYLADQYDGVFERDTAAGRPTLRVNRDASAAPVPSFLRDMGFESVDDIDDDAVEQTIIPATRRSLAERRQQTLATMVLMGMNRVIVSDGELLAKLQFHIDASETTSMRFDQSKVTTGNMAKSLGRGSLSANAIMVNTASINAQSDINVRADLTGQVKVNFRSDVLPLERFADSAAIQLINQNARVPQPTAATGAPPSTSPTVAPAPGAAITAPTPSVATTPPLPAPPPAATPPPAAQSLQAEIDPWLPREGRT